MQFTLSSGRAVIPSARLASGTVESETLQASLQVPESRVAGLLPVLSAPRARLVRPKHKRFLNPFQADCPGAWRLLEIPCAQDRGTVRIRLRLFRGARHAALPKNW